MNIPFELDTLIRWLDAHDIGHGELEQLELLTGGTQNILLRFRRSGASYVLRRPPAHKRANSSEAMRREARVLEALALTEVPHPRLVASCDEEETLGAAFYIMKNVDGFNATSGLPLLHASSEAIRHQMGLALVEGIAKLASYDYQALGLGSFGRPDGFLKRQVARWNSQLASYGMIKEWDGASDCAVVEPIAEWLEANVPIASRPALIHGDYHIANVMFAKDTPEIAAIIDWELSTIGDPLVDLGWLIATWPEEPGAEENPFDIHPWRGFPSPVELAQHYQDVTNRSVSSLSWYVVLACFKLGILLEGTYARACGGSAPRDVGLRLHRRTLALFERAGRQIEKGSITC